MRIAQWYKNLLVFLPLVFAGSLFEQQYLFAALLGFLSLCLISSSSYFINDIKDLAKDKVHPQKSQRLLASGRITVVQAWLISVVLLGCGLALGWTLSLQFFLIALGLFVLTQLYTFFLKTVAFADVLTIAVNFVLRALAGVFIVASTPFTVSSWLLLCPFFLALFLAVGKRASEVRLHKDHREVLIHYTPEMVRSLLVIATTCLIIAYTLYAFFSQYPGLLFTLPFALYTILRFLHLIFSGSSIPQHLELLYKDRHLVVGVLLWLLGVFLVVYH